MLPKLMFDMCFSSKLSSFFFRKEREQEYREASGMFPPRGDIRAAALLARLARTSEPIKAERVHFLSTGWHGSASWNLIQDLLDHQAFPDVSLISAPPLGPGSGRCGRGRGRGQSRGVGGAVGVGGAR